MTVLNQLPADAPLGIRSIMEQCLRYNREERPSMESVFQQLQQLAVEVESARGDGTASPALHESGLLKQTKRAVQVYGSRFAFIAGAVVLGVAVAGAVSLWRSHVKSRPGIDTVKLLAPLLPQDHPGVSVIKPTL